MAKKMATVHQAETAHALLVHGVVYRGMADGEPDYAPKTLCGRRVKAILRRKYAPGQDQNCLRCDASYRRMEREVNQG